MTMTTAVSYDYVLRYLENEFLPSVTVNAIHGDSVKLRQRRNVGTALELQVEKKDEDDDDIDLSQTESALGEMARTLVGQFEVMLKKDDDDEHLAPHGKTAMSLLEALNQSMSGITCLASSRKMKLFSLHTLLMFTNKLVENMNVESQKVSVPLRINLAETVCKVFRHLEKIPFAVHDLTDSEMRMHSGCFCSCLLYLCRLLLLGQQARNSDTNVSNPQTIMAQLVNLLREFAIVGSVIFQLRPYERYRPVTSKEHSAVLDFFSLVATSGDFNMISFLVCDEIAPLLNEIIRSSGPGTKSTGRSDRALAQQGSQPLQHYYIRGYQPSQSNTTGLLGNSGGGMLIRSGWEEDPRHINCTRAYEFLAVLLRAVTDISGTLPRDQNLSTKRFYDKALYCLNCNRNSVQNCLAHVSNAALLDTIERSSVGGQHGSGSQQGFTMQVLREASAIFALLAELCDSNGEADMFRQKYPKLYEEIIVDARRVVLSISSFLGASGVSRELFQSMSDLEKGNGGSLSGARGSGARLGFSPVIDVFLSSGRNNTRHEAIQFSHFVSGCSAAVSATERKNQLEFPAAWSQPKAPGSPEALTVQPVELTESSLEQNSRCAMTNTFALALELEAAKCLFHAANTLWATHPAITSFIHFTPEEISHMRYDISWIKVGDIIGYRKGESLTAEQVLGEVVHVDTVNLCCYVRPVYNKENQGSSFVVPLHLLTGIEDRTKRQGTVAFTHAPETSSDLQKSRVELSVGHLILAMRWCHEYAFEEEQQGLTPSPWIAMNAKVLAFILAKEMCLHRENGNIQRVPPTVVCMLNAQLLDLFGEEQEFAPFLGEAPSAMRRKGRLCNLIPPTWWNAVRSQLSGELGNPIQNINTEAQKQSAASAHIHYYCY